MEDKDNSINEGRIPISELNRLNEFCAGGFVLFFINNETGQPEYASTFDSPVCAIALTKFMSDYCKAINDITLESTKEQIIANNVDDDEEED